MHSAPIHRFRFTTNLDDRVEGQIRYLKRTGELKKAKRNSIITAVCSGLCVFYISYVVMETSLLLASVGSAVLTVGMISWLLIKSGPLLHKRLAKVLQRQLPPDFDPEIEWQIHEDKIVVSHVSGNSFLPFEKLNRISEDDNYLELDFYPEAIGLIPQSVFRENEKAELLSAIESAASKQKTTQPD